MDLKNRLGRSVATSAVALFVVTGAVLGASGLAQERSSAGDAASTAEPTETADDHGGDDGSDNTGPGSDNSGSGSDHSGSGSDDSGHGSGDSGSGHD
jgi:hypothetical protein